MLEFWSRLFDSSGFAPPQGESWTPELVWLHSISDLLIWLAYVSIPLILLYFSRRRDLPFSRLFALFALFILACGTDHLLEAVTLEYPVYRLQGLVKAVTAILSWWAVLALVPIVPRMMLAVQAARGSDTGLHSPLAIKTPADWKRAYTVAVLAAIAALIARAIVDPLMKTDHMFVFALLAVMYLAWQHGFYPAIVTLVLSVVGYSYFFVHPRYSFVTPQLSNQLAVTLFFFCGVACAALGKSHRLAQKQARDALEMAMVRQQELMAEIIQRERTEEMLRASEQRFQNLVESLPQLVWTCHTNGECDYLSRQWVEYTGRPARDQLGFRWLDAVHPDDRERLAEAWREAVRSEREFHVEFRVRRHDGVYRWFDTRAVLARNQYGVAEKWYGTNTDIEDRKQAEEAIRHGEQRFRTLTDAVPQMVWQANPRGESTYFNRRWFEFTGREMNSNQASIWGTDLIHPDDKERVRASWELAVARNAEEYIEEFRLRRASDGDYRWLLSVAKPLRYAGGQVDEWVGSLTDIDDQKRYAETLERVVRERTAALMNEVQERKAAEEQVQSIATELQRSNTELEQFAYVASHDLQEPLRKIQAFGDRLATKCRETLSDDGKDYVDRMLNAAGRMRRLIDDLLTYSRVATQQREFATLDMPRLVQEVVSDLSVRIQQTQATVKVEELPTVDGDPSQMRQLFQNLIANAVKFHRPDVPPVVTIRGEVMNGETARITVTDNGIGLDEKYLDRIFEVFQRLHGKHEYEGTGVGLAICRKIVERHGGTITAQSRVGDGATFVVELPLRQPNRV